MEISIDVKMNREDLIEIPLQEYCKAAALFLDHLEKYGQAVLSSDDCYKETSLLQKEVKMNGFSCHYSIPLDERIRSEVYKNDTCSDNVLQFGRTHLAENQGSDERKY